MLIALMLQAAQPPAAAFDHPWLRIGRSPALTGVSEEITVARMWDGEGPARRSVDWARLIRHDRRGGRRTTTTFYAQALTCPALGALPTAVAAFPMPHAISPDTPTDIVLDGVGYTATLDAGYGERPSTMTVESNVYTPLADWVEARFASLQPCWTPA